MSSKRFIKSESSNDPLVIYKDKFSGVYYTTPKSNYDARIQNAHRIQKWDGFDTPQEIIDYCTKYSSGFDPQNVIIVEDKQSEARGSVIDKQTILDWVEQLNSEQDLGLATTDANLGGKETQYEDDADDKQFDCIKFTSNVFPLTFVEVYSITPDSCSVHVYDGRTNKEVGKATLTDSSDLRTAVVASIKQIYDSVHNQRLVDKAMKLQESLNKGTSMKTESIDDLKDRSVSHGTLRSIDLIPEFLGVLKQYAKDRYDAYVKANPEVLDLDGMDDETLSWVVDELVDELNAVAPEGTYFGSHPGDGSDFGFWTMDESKKSEAYEDIWRGAKVMTYQDAVEQLDLSAEREQNLIDEFGEDYWDNPDAMSVYGEELLNYIDSMFGQDYVSIDGEEIPLGLCREPKLLIVQTTDHKGGKKAVELVKKLVNGELTGSSDDGDYVAIMDGVNGSPHFDIYSEGGKSEGKDDKDKKDGKSCKGKDCKDGKQTENREKPQEGPGAGYTVTIKGMTISDEPKISKDGDKFIVEAPVEYEADAEGYDWSSAYIMNELVGTDEGTFPHNPFKGVLTMEVKDSPDIWGAMQNSFFADRDNPTEEEKMEIITDVFHKGATFNDFEQSYGGGYTHSKFVSEDGVCMQADYYGFNDIDFGSASEGYIGGTLTIDDRFIEDIEYAHDYSSNQYEFVEAIKKFVEDRGLEIDWSDEALYDFVAPNVPSEVTESDVREALSSMIDSGVEFTDADGNPADLQLESIQGESKKSEASGNIRYDVPISSTTYASELESLVSKLKTLGISVKPKIYAEEDSTNGYAEYKLFGANSSDSIVVIVSISENHYTRITAITNRGKLVMEGYGQTFDEALSALNLVEESKKSEVVSDTAPDDMKVGKFSATLLADDNEYVGSVPGFYDDEVSAENAAKDYLKKNGSVIKSVGPVPTKISIWTVVKDDYGSNLPKDVKVVNITADESKKSESLTLKQKELKDMVRYGKAEDITTLPDEEAKELRKKGIETVGVSRGTYGMNGALLRDKDGNLYAITARSTNLFYFV